MDLYDNLTALRHAHCLRDRAGAIASIRRIERLDTGRLGSYRRASEFLRLSGFFNLDEDEAMDAFEEWAEGTFRPSAYTPAP